MQRLKYNKPLNTQMKKNIFTFIFTLAVFIIADAQTRPSIEWVVIPAGSYMMGSPTSELERQDDEIQHLVNLSSFKLSKNEITVGQYKQYCNETGQSMPNPPIWGWEDEMPMCNVTWEEANSFAIWMGLPTEAEWEYACRAGTNTKFWFGDVLPETPDNYISVSTCILEFQTDFTQIKQLLSGEKSANLWGLVNMHGSM